MATSTSNGTPFRRTSYASFERTFHRSVLVKDKLFIWGGLQNGLPYEHDSPQKQEILSEVDVFDMETGVWDTWSTIGKVPLGVAGYACTAVDDKIYYFGGSCGHGDYCLHNSLSALDTTQQKWREIFPTTKRAEQSCPMRKAWCGLVSFKCTTDQTEEDLLLVVGGQGIFPSTQQANSKYVPVNQKDDMLDSDEDEEEHDAIKGRTNEHHIFSIHAAPGEWPWSSPTVTGACPPACNAFSFNKLSEGRAIMYGGVTGSGATTSNIYIADLSKHKVNWTSVHRSLTKIWPVERAFHGAGIVPGPGLLAHGGEDGSDQTLDDCWILNLKTMLWEQIDMRQTLIGSRSCHSLSCISLGDQCVIVVMYGGGSGSYCLTSNPTVLEIDQETDDRWSTCEVYTETDLHLNKDYLLKIKTRMLEREESCSKKLAQELSLASKNAEAKIQMENEQLRQQNDFLQQQLQQSTQQKNQLSKKLSTDKITADERLQWVIAREEVIIKDEKLGNGAWGCVNVAEFRGLRVAAKSLHSVIISDFSRSLFYREMFIASRIRHPNLVQFIGAIEDGSPIIITELMPTSLRKQLESSRLSDSQIISIANDTALALNYLHLTRPVPIIHRDLSSPNILLEPSRQNSWKAKISDFGSANFASQIHPQSTHPGNPAYSAPEACYPGQHSIKMDTYSFGVVLMEMCIHEPPSLDSADKERQMTIVDWPEMFSLISHCACQSIANRLTMQQILIELRSIRIR